MVMKNLLIILFLIFFNPFILQFSYADIERLQNKYNGLTINNKTLDKKDILKIYNNLPRAHPFMAFDKIMNSPSAIKEVNKNCKHQNKKYNYFCKMAKGTAEIQTKNNKIIKYRLTGNVNKMISELTNVLVKSKLSDANQKVIVNMMFDIVLTRFNDVAPTNIKYFRKNKYDIIVIGQLE